jgi:hypothetical protein
MIRPGKFFILLLSMFIANSTLIFSQAVNVDSLSQFKTIVAGHQYKAAGLYKWFWGNNYRNLWTTPVSVKVLKLDTAFGGLTIIKADSSGESKNLYLKNKDGKTFILTSVNKAPGKRLTQHLRDTYAEDWVNDAVSITNPYAAATMPDFVAALGAHRSNVMYVYLPWQPALSVYNNFYGDDLYKLEQLADTDQNNNAINTENYIGTAQLLDILNNNSDSHIDKSAFIGERLFDMFVNDWDRGENKWRWEKKVQDTKQIYKPAPADRDAAYTKYNGKFTKLGFNITNASLIQSFENDLKNVNTFNFREKDLDRRLLNETTLSDWQNIVSALQQSLTDEVIEDAIKDLPKEIYPLTGNEIINKLKGRRTHLREWAHRYYHFLSREIDIPGTVSK